MREYVKLGVDKLNTLTKYPSILTYHELGERGRLNEVLNNVQPNEELKELEVVFVTEKIDGTNFRIIVNKNGYIIGSREHLLHAKEDLIISDPWVNAAIPYAERLLSIVKGFDTKQEVNIGLDINEDTVFVFYGELYGANIGRAARNYTDDKDVFNFRLFDIAYINNLSDILISCKNIDEVHNIRENERKFFSVFEQVWFDNLNISTSLNEDKLIQFVPFLASRFWTQIPKTLEGIYEFLKKFDTTKVAIGEKEAGRSEGIVIRSDDRRFIRKVRFEDYERTFKYKSKKKK